MCKVDLTPRLSETKIFAFNWPDPSMHHSIYKYTFFPLLLPPCDFCLWHKQFLLCSALSVPESFVFRKDELIFCWFWESKKDISLGSLWKTWDLTNNTYLAIYEKLRHSMWILLNKSMKTAYFHTLYRLLAIYPFVLHILGQNCIEMSNYVVIV